MSPRKRPPADPTSSPADQAQEALRTMEAALHQKIGAAPEGSWNAPMEEGGSFSNVLLSITKSYRNVERILPGHQHVCQSMFCGACRSKDP